MGELPTAFPLAWPAGWPRTPSGQRKEAAFQTEWARSVDGLMEEVRRLGSGTLIISSNVPHNRYGVPYADQARDKISDPGVAIYFTLKGKPRVMARDAHPTVHQNLHSIKLAIEYMRGLARHGGGVMMNRAFEGFVAIEASRVKSWSAVLGVSESATPQQIETAYRKLARERHPDQGGSKEKMAELNAARDAALARTQDGG